LAACELEVSFEDFDRQPFLLNCVNGTVDLTTGELREHRREDLLTQLCPTRYDPGAKCPRFRQFLREVLPDAEVRGYVQRLLGYCASGSTATHVLPILYGSGRNGKSTLMEVVMGVLGRDYATAGLPGLLLVPAGERHPTGEAYLWGKRLVVLSEFGEGRKLDAEVVKRLTGGDLITARRMREDPWAFEPTHKLALYCNHRPAVADPSPAMWDRLRLIGFDVYFAEGRRDPGLKDKLLAEREGVLAWLVRGCIAWHRPGGSEAPESVRAQTEDYRVEEDVVGQFLAERWPDKGDVETPGQWDETPKETWRADCLYEKYTEWAKATGIKFPLSQKRLGAALKERGYDNSGRDPETRRKVWRRPP
jgi:putative DNA primase/helicase